MSSKKFSHRVTWTKSGGLCSEHYTEGGALKAVRRYVAPARTVRYSGLIHMSSAAEITCTTVNAIGQRK